MCTLQCVIPNRVSNESRGGNEIALTGRYFFFDSGAVLEHKDVCIYIDYILNHNFLRCIPLLFEQLFRVNSQYDPVYNALQIHCSRLASSI